MEPVQIETSHIICHVLMGCPLPPALLFMVEVETVALAAEDLHTPVTVVLAAISSTLAMDPRCPL
jgi:hypothetical protein